MAFSGNQITRNSVGGSGRAYLGFVAKAESDIGTGGTRRQRQIKSLIKRRRK